MTETAADIAGATPDAFPEFPMPRAERCPFDPPPGMRAMRAERRIGRVRLWDGSTPWLVTGYGDMRTLLSDPRLSSDTRHPSFPHQSAGIGRVRDTGPRSFINMDDPEHARRRRMVTAAFSVRRVESMRPAIQGIVDGFIDAMLAGPRPADLVEAFALPVPSMVICELLGVPYSDHAFFQGNSKVLVNRNSAPEDAAAADAALTDYLEDLVGRKLADPADDVISRLAVERVGTGELTRREAAAVGTLLLGAGHETTANMIALGTLALLQNPEQLAAVRESDDPKLIAGAVEELLRYLNITQTGRRRVALEDIEVGDQTIRAGDGVIVSADVANREDEMFPDPDRLDVHRDARRHLAFGFGVHQCLGQPLARVELQVVYGTLYRRIPTLRLAVEPERIAFKHDGIVYGVYELPVTW